MKVSYVMHEDMADSLHNLHGIVPLMSCWAGIYGHKRYVSLVDSNEVAERVWRETALPFSFCITNDEVTNVTDACHILKAYVRNKTGLFWDSCEVIKYESFYLVYPVFGNDYMYLSDDESLEMDVDASQLSSKSLLTRHFVATESLTNMFWVSKFGSVTVFDSLVRNILSEREVGSRVTDVETRIVSEIQSGITHVGRGSEIMHGVLSELTHVWGIAKEESERGIVCSSEGTVLSGKMACSLSRWIEDSVFRLVLGKVPLVPLTGKWLSGEDRTILNYCCVLSLRETVARNSYMSAVSERDVLVTPSLVVYVPALCPNDFLTFSQALERYSSNTGAYYVHYISDSDGELLLANSDYDPVIFGTKMVTTSPVLLRGKPYVTTSPVLLRGEPYVEPLDGEVTEDEDGLYVSVEGIRRRLPGNSLSLAQKEWREGKLVTNWGRYLMDRYGIVSVLLVRPF